VRLSVARRLAVIVRKSAREIEALREAGRVVALAHAAIREAAAVGTTLRELDEVAHDVMREHDATPAFLDYQPHFAPTPFPGVICASVNDVVVHGIPTEQTLADGDLVSIDIGVFLNGWVGDAARSFIVGTPRRDDEELIANTWAALEAGIAAAVPGNRLGDVGHAIGTIGRKHGYGIPDGWGGHGVGREMHEDPSVPNEGEPGRGLRLKPGLVIAIEPMFMAGGDDGVRIDDDGWTIRTVDGSRAAHTEHTIAVTDDGPRVLTDL
jgi:methionyl aminopeptidase